MTKLANRESSDPRDPSFYGESYYTDNLHHRHWFKDNDAKRRLRLQTVIHLLQPTPRDRLLDLGCANGSHSVALKPMVAEVIGVDFSEAAIRIATQRAAGMSSISFIRCDVAHLDAIESESMDKAVAIDLVEHITDDTLASMLQEVWRVLKPGGRFVFYTPSATHYVERLKACGVLKQLPGHIAVRDEKAYERLLGQLPWKHRSIESLPSSYPLFGLVDRLLMRNKWFGSLFRFRIVGTVSKP